MTIVDNIPVWGEPLPNAVAQMANCLKTAYRAALMADHHLGYAVPVGGVIAYKDAISPSGVGYDIGCGNKAVLTDATLADITPNIGRIMDDVASQISFGIGRKNNEPVEHRLFEDSAWERPEIKPLKDMARAQLGTVGSGNHYVDIFHDERQRIWVGVHFGSRGLGHKLATHYIKAAGGRDGINVDPCIIRKGEPLWDGYLAAMHLAGQYAYAGRDAVCAKVLQILGVTQLSEVHNHHNFAWWERHDGEMLWVVRKGATPAFPGQQGFVGGSMGENSVILEGVDHLEAVVALRSTVHGAGRAMSRTEAAGKIRWKGGVKTRVSEGKVSEAMMAEWIAKAGVALRGAGVDESPHCYKRLPDVLKAHANSIHILHTLTPIGVAMAGAGEADPFKD